MYKMIIIDDEKFIRKSIRNRMDWEKFGITQVDEAGNGEEALHLLDTLRPEIVLVDIRMPRMDGLQFIMEAKKKYPETNYIIMSAYSDFSYAKKAIDLGVEGYLLKPVDKEELEELLNKLLNRLNQKKLNRMLQNVRKGELARENILRHPYCLAMAVYAARDEDLGMKLLTIVEHQIEPEKECSVYYLSDFSRSDCYVFLLNLKEESRSTGLWCMKNAVKAMGDPQVRAAVSQVFGRERFQEAASQALCFLKSKIFDPDRAVISSGLWGLADREKEQRRSLREKCSQLYELLMADRFDIGERSLSSLIDQLLKETNSITLIEEGIEEILFLLDRLSGRLCGAMDFNILFHGFRSRDYLLTYDTGDQVKDELEKLVRELLAMLNSTETGDVIDSIREYIERNYRENLNVAELAREYGLNASYLSTLFKERTGINFTAYLEGIRMEKAKRLLEDGKESITEVALQTGYSNSNYFSKVFKKYTGVTPREFRAAGNAG